LITDGDYLRIGILLRLASVVLSIAGYLLGLVTRNGTHDRVFLALYAVSSAFNIVLSLRGFNLGLSFRVLLFAAASPGLRASQVTDSFDGRSLDALEKYIINRLEARELMTLTYVELTRSLVGFVAVVAGHDDGDEGSREVDLDLGWDLFTTGKVQQNRCGLYTRQEK